MTDLFGNPVQMEVLGLDSGEVQLVVRHRGVVAEHVVPADRAPDALVEEIRSASRRAGLVVGAVVFNAVLQDVAECGFLASDGERTWDAKDEELPEQQERRWENTHRAWKHTHRPAARRAAAHVEERPTLPAPALSVRIPDYAPPAPHARPQAAPPAARSSVSQMDSLMERGKHPEHAREGWRGALNMVGLRLPPGKDEDTRRKLVRSIQLGWPGVGYATVVNEKGSTGKTPTSLMLAGALQAHCKGQVIVRDGNPSGNAHERAEYIPPVGRDEHGQVFNDGDLARRFLEGGPMENSQLWEYLHLHTTDHYALLSHHVQHGELDLLSDEQSDAAYQALAPLARAVITDTGNVPWERRDVPVLHRTQQLVVPMLTYADRDNGARKTLGDTLESRGGRYLDLVRNAIVVIHTAEGTSKHERRAKEYEARWLEAGAVRQVVVVPYDEHMASHDLRFGDLEDATRTALLRVAAGVAEGFRAP